ncbi:MAG TPA: DegT/DnrJ/EryC1/StrS family aminotransferase [Polyangiaceae bacterium]|nr:DegT/DnrJ/EryC1/StrS family aminotransferase [Polyangiaceae bacterium]
MQFSDLQQQHERFKEAIDRRLARLFAHGQYIMGPEVRELEDELSRYVGVAHAITVKSGTAGLELALRALGVGPGDEVITTPFSWISAAETIALCGARPVFVDIEPDGFNLNAAQVERAVTARTRAILPVSLFGQLPDFTELSAIAERHRLFVIEDGAQSFGASQAGRRSGSFSTVGVTSFFPTKPLGCFGDGGALFTSDGALADKLRALRAHGAAERGQYTLVGHNARLDTLQAAILLAKLPRLDAELDERRRLAQRYDRALAGYFRTPLLLPGNDHVYAQYTLRVAERDKLAARLSEAGIPTAVHYRKCLHEQPVFAGLATPGSLPEAERAAREVLSLPLYPGLRAEDQQRVIDALTRAAQDSGGEYSITQ